jgi:DNA-binding NtrC family response regulator
MSALRILHLEDNPADADLIQAMLDAEGLTSEITRAATGEAFFAALKEGNFDLILADHSLPSFNGIAALALAHKRHPDVPFIFVSGAMGEELAAETLKNGATDYVLKQHLERFVPTVLRALRESGERRKHREVEVRLLEEKLEAELASAAKTRLLERTAGELSVPINAIWDSARSLELNALSESQYAEVQQILNATQQVRDLLDSLLVTAPSPGRSTTTHESATDESVIDSGG